MAAKADDAEVPEYLWMEHLFDDSPRAWQEQDKVALLGIADRLRNHMLRWWKRRICKSFLLWLRCRYPSLEKVIGDAETGVVFNSQGVYEWESSGQDGLLIYKRWWLERFGLCNKDLIVGSDAVARASNTTW